MGVGRGGAGGAAAAPHGFDASVAAAAARHMQAGLGLLRRTRRRRGTTRSTLQWAAMTLWDEAVAFELGAHATRRSTAMATAR